MQFIRRTQHSKQTRESTLKVEDSCLPWRWRQKNFSEYRTIRHRITEDVSLYIYRYDNHRHYICHLWRRWRAGLLNSSYLGSYDGWKNVKFLIVWFIPVSVKNNNSCFCIILTTDRDNKLFLFRCVLEFQCGWVGVVSVLQASACNTDTTPTQPNRNSNAHRTKNNTTSVVIQQNSRKALDDGYINVRNILST